MYMDDIKLLVKKKKKELKTMIQTIRILHTRKRWYGCKRETSREK